MCRVLQIYPFEFLMIAMDALPVFPSLISPNTNTNMLEHSNIINPVHPSNDVEIPPDANVNLMSSMPIRKSTP